MKPHTSSTSLDVYFRDVKLTSKLGPIWDQSDPIWMPNFTSLVCFKATELIHSQTCKSRTNQTTTSTSKLSNFRNKYTPELPSSKLDALGNLHFDLRDNFESCHATNSLNGLNGNKQFSDTTTNLSRTDYDRNGSNLSNMLPSEEDKGM